MDTVLVERREDGIAVVRLNRPEQRNALNLDVRRRLAEAFGALSDDTQVRCVILTGNEEAFAAGADLTEMVDVSAIELYTRHTEALWRRVAECRKPIVAAVNGYALGGGLELAMHADVLVVGESASLGQPEVRVGIMPGAGGTQRLTRAVGKFQAMRLCLTGRPIDGKEAFQIGLASKVVADADVFAEAEKIAGDIAKMPPVAIEQTKEVLLQGQDASLEAAMALERKAMQLLFAGEDQKEGMRAFLEKRKPNYSGN
jgi:enoyl-CoA hydratase/carnithine racemase